MRLLWCVLLLPALASAEIYRWVDANGQVHFGQRPGSAAAEAVTVDPQVVERDAATREREARTQRFYDARREEQARAAAQASERKASKARECSELRSRLANIPEGRRYFKAEADGQRSYYSDAELDAARRELRNQLVLHCS